MTVRIGIDTGGTFTDLIGIDEATDQLVIAKTPSTPRRPAQAVINAIKSCGVPGEAISALSIGTTVAANALLQRRGANVIYVTTRGFEDIPYIQRMNRKYHFSLKWRKPKPLVERRNCLGLDRAPRLPRPRPRPAAGFRRLRSWRSRSRRGCRTTRRGASRSRSASCSRTSTATTSCGCATSCATAFRIFRSRSRMRSRRSGASTSAAARSSPTATSSRSFRNT